MNFLIIGKPNVGKSSLFNIISADKNNIIHKSIGTTRDWHHSQFKNNLNINIYDTPGIDKINKKIFDNKFENLINKIDIFLYLIDYKSSNYVLDKEIINFIRKYNKEIILIINKDDNFNQDKDLNTFGLNNHYYISCSHKLGIDNLLDNLEKNLVKKKQIQKEDYSIGLFGKTNVGKSTLLNQLVGYNRSLVSNTPKTTTDIVTSSYTFKGNSYSIKDTAGLIKKNKIDKESLDYYATKKTLSIIKEPDVNLFMIDVEQGFDNQSKKIFNLISEKSNILIFIINKIDLINANKKKILSKLQDDIKAEFSQSKNFIILTLSSLNKRDITSLKNYIHNVTFKVNKQFSTSNINKWLKLTTNQKPHSRIKGKEVKFKYATQILTNPLTLKIFSNFSKEISTQYKRFLINSFYEYFKIKSKNIKIIFSKSSNPFN